MRKLPRETCLSVAGIGRGLHRRLCVCVDPTFRLGVDGRCRSPHTGEPRVRRADAHHVRARPEDRRRHSTWGPSGDLAAIEAARRSVRREFVWVRRDGVDYVITDDSLLAPARQAWQETNTLGWQIDLLNAAMAIRHDLAAQHRRMKQDAATLRKSLTVPADPARVRTLAGRYQSAELGNIDISRKGATTWLDVGGWRSELASRRNDDSTTTLVTISPGLVGWLEFAVDRNDNRRSLVLRDEQREYVFVAAE